MLKLNMKTNVCVGAFLTLLPCAELHTRSVSNGLPFIYSPLRIGNLWRCDLPHDAFNNTMETFTILKMQHSSNTMRVVNYRLKKSCHTCRHEADVWSWWRPRRMSGIISSVDVSTVPDFWISGSQVLFCIVHHSVHCLCTRHRIILAPCKVAVLKWSSEALKLDLSSL